MSNDQRNEPVPAGLGNSPEPIGSHTFELIDTRAAEALAAARERWRKRLRRRGEAFELYTELQFFEALEREGWRIACPFEGPERLYPPLSLRGPGTPDYFEVVPGFLR